MNVIIHEKGNHKSNNLILKFWLKAPILEQEFMFTDYCKYNHNSDDQKDWNKLTGISFNLINAKLNSIMCGWRYNIENDEFELCAYYHINGSFNPPSIPLCSVKANEKFKVKIDFDRKKRIARLTINDKYIDESNFKRFWICRQINTWFGGNLVSPVNMFIIKY